MREFKLSDQSDFIPLDKLLKLLGLVGSGGEAHRAIEEGLVRVNDVVELQKRKKLRENDTLKFSNNTILISK